MENVPHAVDDILFGQVVRIVTNNCSMKGDIKIQATGKNALDYALVSILAGSLSLDEVYAIHSNDTGYDYAISYLCEKGYFVERCFYASQKGGSVGDLLLELYKRRQLGKLTGVDVTDVFGKYTKSLHSTLLQVVNRAYKLGISVSDFEAMLSGTKLVVDISLRQVLLWVYVDSGESVPKNLGGIW